MTGYRLIPIIGILSILPAMTALPDGIEGASRPDARTAIDVTLTGNGFRSTNGLARFAIFNGPAGFPDTPGKAMFTNSCAIAGNRAVAIIRNVMPGTYAIAILHDENANGKMDYTMLRFPSEGFAVSGSDRSFFIRPRFANSTMELSHSNATIKLDIRYMGRKRGGNTAP